jgi:hypothetical protein
MANNAMTIQPPFRTVIDLILITDIGLLFLHAVFNVPTALTISMADFLNLLELLVWAFWVRKHFSIDISDEVIEGPGPDLKKVSFPRSNLDVWRTENLRPTTKPKGYLDLWSQDGKRVRLFRKILGRGHIFIISQMLLGDAFESNKKKYRYI